MTRIDIIPVEEYHDKHIVSAIKEVPRVFNLVRKAQERGINKWNKNTRLKIPKEYTMGTGHVTYFYDKLDFVAKQYAAVCAEHRRRGGIVNEISREELLSGIDKSWIGSYDPASEALEINRKRIRERINNFK